MKAMLMRPQNLHRLPAFAAASLGLHVALLLATAPAAPPVTIEPASTLTITLDAETPAPTNRSAMMPAPTTQRRHQEPATATTVARAAPTTLPTRPDAGDSTESASDGATGGHSDEVRSWVLTKLLGDLRRHFEYPLLARHRGWEGTVWLSFVVAPDGELERIHVARGSGYDALDRSALTALRRVGNLPEAHVRLDGRALEIQLPVIYRLSE